MSGRRERRLVAGMVTVALLLIAAQTMTKTARDALFLTQFNLKQLCWVMVTMAGLAAAGIALFERISRRFRRDRVILVLYVFVAVTLWAVSCGLRTPHRALLSWLLYVWSGVFTLMTLAEYWLLANSLFDARQGKRLFGLLGAGAVLGGLIGGLGSAVLAHHGGPILLLRVSAVALLLAGLLTQAIWRARTATQSVLPPMVDPVGEPAGQPVTLRELVRDQYVRSIALLVLCTVVCLTLLEWQYKAAAKMHFGDHVAAMTAFFGWVAGAVNAVVFAVQTLCTSRLLQRFGVAPTLRLLPSAAGLGAIAVLSTLVLPLAPLAPAALAVMGTDGLRFSVDKAAIEMLYMPMERRLRDRARRVIDIFVDRLAGALAGLLWLALILLFHVDEEPRLAVPSVLVLLVALLWLWRVYVVRRDYVDAYRHVIGAGDVAFDAPPHELIVWATEQLTHLPADPSARTQQLRHINQRQLNLAPLALDRMIVEPYLANEVGYAKRLRRALFLLNLTPRSYRPLLRALDTCLARAMERIGRLLALVYPPRDIYFTHRALHAKSRRMRAAAVELIDAMVVGDTKQDLVELLEESAALRGRSAAAAQGNAREVLADLSRDQDPELRKWARLAEHNQGGQWAKSYG